MNDKSNILAGLMPRQRPIGGRTNNQTNDKENAHNINNHQPMDGSQLDRENSSSLSGASKQHKLKQRFTVIRKLGKGTYGKVQLAINKKTGQEVAIKTIKKTKIETEQDLQRVRREIQIMSSIEHPHIIHIYEVFENKDKIVLVMQYAPGGELFEYVSQSKTLDDGEARRLFRQIATAIYYCHQNKICHRDLKLENILLDEKNNAKLADFGLSNVFDKRRQLSTFCGSPLYASPEIVQGSPYEGPEVDCWSLGVLLYTLVYGAMPFNGTNFKRLVKQISEACYFEPKQKSLASPLIRRLLCADPNNRATILDICADSWVNNNLLHPSGSTRPALDSNSPVVEHPESQQQQQAHTSLLKVAQDMANLTPVRFDILLALVPSSPQNVQTAKEAQVRPPLAMILDQASSKDAGSNETQVSAAAQRQRELALEPTRIMDVDQTREASPVASYIVRDLDLGEQGQVPNQPDQSEDTAQLSVEPDKQEVSVSNAMATQDEQEAIENIQPQSVPIEIDDEQMQLETACEEDIQKQSTMVVPDDVGLTSEPLVEQDKNDQDEVNNTEDSGDKPKLVSEVIGMEVDISQPTIGDDANIAQAAIECEPNAKENDLEEVPTGGEKPKKIKKKIIVIKKRKKVPKKDQEVETGKQEMDKTLDKTPPRRGSGGQQQQQVEPNQEQPQQKTTVTKVGSKGPGKIRIPNTFQAPNDNKEPPPVARTGAEGRRPSALVVDVSQKLLSQQQQSQMQSPTPVQVANARVADKRSDFERRASLASFQIQPGSLAKDGFQQKAASVAGDPERAEHQLLCEVLNLIDQIEQTTAEPVDKRQPLQVEPAKLLSHSISASSQRFASEFQTPTANDAKETQAERDSQQRLAEWTGKLSEMRRGSGLQQSSLDPSHIARNDRSDSIETIKPDVPQTRPQAGNVRTSVQIDLGGRPSVVKNSDQEYPTASVSRDIASIGPSPITRSYKKVTFTKDGACVTETGKIYSKQCDDGTIRRIERKSKVTHYPAGDSSTESASNLDEIEQREVAFGSGKIGETSFWQSAFQGNRSISTSIRGQPQLRPFEKLIMPSTGVDCNKLSSLLTDDDEDEEIGDEVGREFDRRRSLFSRQSLGRADSDAASSCSSGSTDVFDDIFDTWTGAISMFNRSNQHHRKLMHRLGSGSLMDPVNEPLINDSHLSADFRSLLIGRAGRHSALGGGMPMSAVSGTPPRCGSVEPRQHRAKGRPRRDRWPAVGAEISGYESDAPLERPASALDGGSRTRPGLGGLSTALDGDLFGGNLLDKLEQEHENLKHRLAERHRQMWKGSTPSLFATSNANVPADKPEKANLWQFLEPHDVELNRENHQRGSSQSHRARSNSGSQSCTIQAQQAPIKNPLWPRPSEEVKPSSKSGGEQQQVGQSQSSSSFLRQSIALDPAPIRKNTANLLAEHQLPPRQTMRHSVSKTSLVTSNQTNSDGRQMTSEKQSACFIQLRRSSPSSGVLQEENTLQRQSVEESLVTSTGTIQKLIASKSGTTSSSSAVIWDVGDRETPTASSVTGCFPQVSSSNEGPSKQMDSRIQNWLQESAGNLSASSGSKSSFSTANEASALPSGASCDKFKDSPLNPYGSLRPKRENITSRLRIQLNDMLPSSSVFAEDDLPRTTLAQDCNTDSIVLQSSAVKHSNSSTILVTSSSSRQSMSESEQGRKSVEQRKHQVFAQTRDSGLDTLIDPLSSTSSLIRVPSRTTSTTFRLDEKFPSTTLLEEDDNSLFDGLQQHHRAISQSSSFSARVSPTLNSPNVVYKNTNSLFDKTTTSDQQEQQQQQVIRRFNLVGDNQLFTGEDVDSQSGAGSADLESHSSSSLLDQLKSRGYRSMINQRNQQQQITSTTSDTSTSLLESTSRSVITSSSIGGDASATKIVHQKQQAVTTSFSVQGSLPKEEDQDSTPQTCIDVSGGLTSFEDDPKKQIPVAQVSNLEEIHSDSSGCPTSRSIQKHESSNANEVNEDEDVREAKASIKSYLDSVKETEIFLKSIQQEEENLERQRQQLFLFNNLLLSSKLSGLRAPSEIRSAPIRIGSSTTNQEAAESGFSRVADETVRLNEFVPSTSLCFEPTYTLPAEIKSQRPASCNYSSTPLKRGPFGDELHRTHNEDKPSYPTYDWQSTITSGGYSAPSRDPLEPIQPLTISRDSIGERSSSYMPHMERRSRSQLSDQFHDYKSRRPRPLSANIQLATGDNIYFPSRAKRSVSQLRYSDIGGAPGGGGYDESSQAMVSEYMSAYGRGASVEPVSSKRHTSANFGSNGIGSYANVAHNDDDDVDDHGMAAYRASAYVPKVVPQGLPIRGKSYQRDQVFKSSWTGVLTERERRTSLQAQARPSLALPHLDSGHEEDKGTSGSGEGQSSRRRSMTDASEPPMNSRLNELEQRLQANKRRREDLLSGKLSPQPGANSDRLMNNSEPSLSSAEGSKDQHKEQQAPTGRPTGNKLVRPSRLESMEARIKRKSYCVRMGDCSPERVGQFQRGSQLLSLEKWRSQASSSAGIGDLRRNSLIGGSLKCNDLLAECSSETKRKLSGGDGSPGSRWLQAGDDGGKASTTNCG